MDEELIINVVTVVAIIVIINLNIFNSIFSVIFSNNFEDKLQIDCCLSTFIIRSILY